MRFRLITINLLYSVYICMVVFPVKTICMVVHTYNSNQKRRTLRSKQESSLDLLKIHIDTLAVYKLTLTTREH